MQSGLRVLGKYILLLLFLLCFGSMLSLQASLNDSNAPVIYDLADNPLSRETLASMREEEEASDAAETLSYTAVGTLGNQTLSNEVLGRSAEGTVFFINGSSSLLVSATGELMADDITGCLLSAEAAWELFGETKVSGGEILCDGISYEVRGVYEDSACAVLLPANAFARAASGSADDSGASDAEHTGDVGVPDGDADSLTELSFNRIIVMPGENLSDAERSEAITLFETTGGFVGEKTDCRIYQQLSAFFVMLIPAILMICVAARGVAGLLKHRRRPFRFALVCMVLPAVFFLFFRIFQISPSVPANLIPNTWSDFDFWEEKIAELTAAIQHLLFQSKSEIELNYYEPLVQLAALAGTGIILLVITNLSFQLKHTEKHTEEAGAGESDTQCIQNESGWSNELRPLTGMLFGTCITELIAVFLLQRWGITLVDKRIFLYLWPYFLIARYAVAFVSGFSSGVSVPEEK